MFNFLKKQFITEETKAFKNKGKSGVTKNAKINTRGEGFDDVLDIGFAKNSVGSFNGFFNNFINTQFTDKRAKIENYRTMAEMPEISSVIEDISIETTQEDANGKIVSIDILKKELENENIQKNIKEQFDDLFNNRLRIDESIMDYITSYFIDSELYIEKVINTTKKSLGIMKLKKLPPETMDYITDQETGEISLFLQYKKPKVKAPLTIEEATENPDIITFLPEQIIYINYGIFKGTKKNVIGYLEKVKQPFNLTKLIETSIVIYRIVRSPERLVFNIDTGAMPKDKALKFVDKIKQKMAQKVEFDSKSGTIKNQPNITSLIENYFLPQSSDGRGSSIGSVGGNPSGFSELDDLYYFSRKLYIALKYPITRVINAEERRQGDSLFMGSSTQEINLDEIRWAKMLSRHQMKFAQAFTDLFLLHLEFQGLKKEYEITRNDINVVMTPPNDYKNQMTQMQLDTNINNYNSLSNNDEFSKTFLMRYFLKWDDETIKANAEGFKDDKRLLPHDDNGY